MAKKKIEKLPELSFEESLERLSTIVTNLENADIPLEEALSSFTQGMALSQACFKKLSQAEDVITDIVKEVGGNIKTESFFYTEE